jgi:hypothetical protein
LRERFEMMRNDGRRGFRSFIPVFLMGIFAGCVVGSDASFVLRSRAGEARVVSSQVVGTRSGALTIAEVEHDVDGTRVEATLRAWFCPNLAGRTVEVLYLQSDPGVVFLDRFWPLHFGSIIAIGLFGIVGTWEACQFVSSRRRQSHFLLFDGS